MPIRFDPTPPSKGWGCLSVLSSSLSSQSPLKRILTITLVAIAILAVIGLLFSILWVAGCIPLILAHPFITLSCILGALTATTLVVVIIGRFFHKDTSPSPKQKTITRASELSTSTPSLSEEGSSASLSTIPPVNVRFNQCIDAICNGDYRATHISEPIDPKSLFDQNDLYALSYGRTLEGHRWISVKATTIQKDPSEEKAHFIFIEKGPLSSWKMACAEDREKEVEVEKNEQTLLLSIVKGEYNYFRLKLDTEGGNESEESTEGSSLEA